MWMRRDVSVDCFNEDSLEVYAAKLASDRPVPGGGGTSAYTAALGVALGHMVGSLTVGKKKYADVEEELLHLMQEAKRLRLDLIRLVSEDAEAFEPLSVAYGMPKATEEERERKAQVMEECLVRAAEVPLQIMRNTAEAVALLEKFEKLGSPLVISDAGVGASLAGAALKGASLNIFINTKFMKNREKAREMNSEAQDILDTYTARADQVFMNVYKRIVYS
jgi:formiminotetrahydrofolate cyclodeaminase